LICQPVQSFDEPIAFRRHRSTNVPRTVLYKRQAQLFGQLGFRHGTFLVLFVREHQKNGGFQLFLF